MEIWTRRTVVRKKEVFASTGALPFNTTYPRYFEGLELLLPDEHMDPPPARPVNAIVIGAGARGNVYGDYAVAFPNYLNVVAVADTEPIRVQRFGDKHHLPDTQRFTDWRNIFKQPVFADAVIVATPDQQHIEVAMEAIQAGYHVLLEKPIAPTLEGCEQLLQTARQHHRMVAVCHVLRYAPYFVELRRIIRSGAIGKLISIQHMEPIEHVHMAHSFVRGNWRNSKTSSPIVLAKSSHDLDILRWLVGKPALSIAAHGGQDWFTSANAPQGSTERCADGCKVEGSCPYSALKIYHRDRKRLYVFDLPEDRQLQGEAILANLATSNYGRCVYRMDNNQCDHFTSTIQFEGGVTATLSVEAFTSYEGRRTRIMGSHGDITGDISGFVHTDFLTGETTEWRMETDAHGGGDWRLMSDWVQAMATGDVTKLPTSLEQSIESHAMAWAAERSRVEGKMIFLR